MEEEVEVGHAGVVAGGPMGEVEVRCLMEAVEVLHCNRRLAPKDFVEPGIHSRLAVGSRIQVPQVVLHLGRPKVDRLRLEERVACHRKIVAGNHNCCQHHDRRQMPMEHRHWNLADQEAPILREHLQQKVDHAPKASGHRQLRGVVRIHRDQLRYAAEDHLDDRT
jgi:hypothetical protein